jgi:hypothetical protein
MSSTEDVAARLGKVWVSGYLHGVIRRDSASAVERQRRKRMAELTAAIEALLAVPAGSTP